MQFLFFLFTLSKFFSHLRYNQYLMKVDINELCIFKQSKTASAFFLRKKKKKPPKFKKNLRRDSNNKHLKKNVPLSRCFSSPSISSYFIVVNNNSKFFFKFYKIWIKTFIVNIQNTIAPLSNGCIFQSHVCSKGPFWRSIALFFQRN